METTEVARMVAALRHIPPALARQVRQRGREKDRQCRLLVHARREAFQARAQLQETILRIRERSVSSAIAGSLRSRAWGDTETAARYEQLGRGEYGNLQRMLGEDWAGDLAGAFGINLDGTEAT